MLPAGDAGRRTSSSQRAPAAPARDLGRARSPSACSPRSRGCASTSRRRSCSSRPQPIVTVAHTLGPRHDVVTRELVGAAHARRAARRAVDGQRRSADGGADRPRRRRPRHRRAGARPRGGRRAAYTGSDALRRERDQAVALERRERFPVPRLLAPAATARSAAARRSRNEPSNATACAAARTASRARGSCRERALAAAGDARRGRSSRRGRTAPACTKPSN